MSLQALIMLSRVRELNAASKIKMREARERSTEFDTRVERQVALKTVGQELLNRACSI